MKQLDLVSVVIPTYNRNDLLFERSLPSVLRQTYRHMEVQIVADGMTGPLLEELAERLVQVQIDTPSIPIFLWNIERPVYPDDSGQMWCVQGINARNFGLDHATGQWIAPLDDDDEWTDDHLEVLLGAAIEKNVDFAYGKAVTPWGQWYGHWPPSGMNFTDGSQIYRHDLGFRYEWACLDRWLPADADLWNRMVAAGVSFTFVDHLVHRYFPARA